MILTRQEGELFFRLNWSLMWFVNQRLGIVPDICSPEEFSDLPAETRWLVRDGFLANLSLIESFIDENPSSMAKDELEIVHSWRNLVAGDFFILRQLQKYTVFLAEGKQPVAYGVVALSLPMEEVVGLRLPVWTKTILLPFRDKIVYDGLLNTYSISFGPGIRRSLNESYRKAKERLGIVTSLPMSGKPVGPAKRTKSKPRPKTNPKEETAEVLAIIVDLIERFCHEHLTDEYALVCRKLAEKLAHKRPSPLVRGKPVTWASGIVRTVGWVNFLYDKTQTPYMRLCDIDAAFGISESSGAAKMAAIRKLLKITPLNYDWTLPSRMADNPLIWMLEVNGIMMDIRQAPREAQEVAFNNGLIPYIPADRGFDVDGE